MDMDTDMGTDTGMDTGTVMAMDTDTDIIRMKNRLQNQASLSD